MPLPLAPATPAAYARAATVARLSNQQNGFNAYLAATCAAAGIRPYTVDFRDSSSTFLMGKYNVATLFAQEDIELPAVAIYQGPGQSVSGDRNIVGALYNGPIVYGIDVHLASFEGESQSAFELTISATFDALVNTFNDMSAISRADFGLNRVLYRGDISIAQPSRLLDPETQQYLSTLSASIRYSVAV